MGANLQTTAEQYTVRFVPRKVFGFVFFLSDFPPPLRLVIFVGCFQQEFEIGIPLCGPQSDTNVFTLKIRC